MSYNEILADQELDQKDLELEAQLEPLSTPRSAESDEFLVILAFLGHLIALIIAFSRMFQNH